MFTAIKTHFDVPEKMEWNWKYKAEKCTTEKNQSDRLFLDGRNKLLIAFKEVAEYKDEEKHGTEQMRPNIASFVVVLEDCFQACLKAP